MQDDRRSGRTADNSACHLCLDSCMAMELTSTRYGAIPAPEVPHGVSGRGEEGGLLLAGDDSPRPYRHKRFRGEEVGRRPRNLVCLSVEPS
jgi:hypothetical protein